MRGRAATEKAGSEGAVCLFFFFFFEGGALCACVLGNVLVAHLTLYANDGPRRTLENKKCKRLS